jgi:hypothetical protein
VKTNARPASFNPSKWVAFTALAGAIFLLGCGASGPVGTKELEPAIRLTIAPEASLPEDPNQSDTLYFLVTVNDRVQFHAVDPKGVVVDDKVSWGVSPQRSALDPLGAIDSKGLYVAPPSPSWVGVSARAENLNPPLRGGIALEVVAAPVISGFSASRSAISPGQTTDLLPGFAHGTGTLLVGAQVVQAGLVSGVPITVSPGATTTYTLKVINPAGASVTQDLQILVQ